MKMGGFVPTNYTSGGFNGRLPRLLEFQHEVVHWTGRPLCRKIARVFWVAPEISLSDEPESGRFHLLAQHALVNAVERLANRQIRCGLGRMVGDHHRATGLERCK